MNKPTTPLFCCGDEATWVDNVPGKEYWYCQSCKLEVTERREILDYSDEEYREALQAFEKALDDGMSDAYGIWPPKVSFYP